MTSQDLFTTLVTLLRELTYGTAPDSGYVLNGGDAGLLASLDRLSAGGASASSHGGATIAAHAAHVAYALSLMNRWTPGENPFASADWGTAWRIGTVADDEWRRVRGELKTEVDRWLSVLATPRDLQGAELNGVVASVAHVAYHMGAMRQIQAAARGPKDGES